MIAPARHKVLAVARKQLGMDEADWRAILSEWGGVTSARDLDDAGFDRVMARLRQLGFVSDHWQAGHGDRADRATPHQLRLIRELWQEGAVDPTEAHLRAWLLKTFKISDLRFATPRMARGAIAALKKMQARRALQRRAG